MTLPQVAMNYGQDGIPHLAYFDKTTQLSFVYDTSHNRVAVSHGGYGEPVVDTFFVDLTEVNRLEEILALFQFACTAYVQGWRMSRA